MSGNYSGETFMEKAQRKFSKEPLIPIGALTTAGILLFGLRAFNRGDKVASQTAMRWRVYAQGFTIAAMCVGALYGMKPHDRPKGMEAKMERKAENAYDDDDD